MTSSTFVPLDAECFPILTEAQHSTIPWVPRAPQGGEAAFPDGFTFDKKVLSAIPETALADFRTFLSLQQLEGKKGAPLRTAVAPEMIRDQWRATVTPEGVTLHAASGDGWRRALVWLEDEMLKRGGPFLPLGEHERTPVIRTRISRCFFGPIQRPPFNRHELDDDVDYYPEPYLNRLAHDGVDVLWITIKFKESVPSKLIPEFGANGERHLAKLRDTVARCARYGIRIYVFCIEPAALPIDSPVLKRYPELKGHLIDDAAAFCTSSAIGQAYVEEAFATLFKLVPGLGGAITIPVGERFTHCASAYQSRPGQNHPPCNCPRCKDRSIHDILADTLAAMRRGIDAANPEAELIAWPYGQMILWGKEELIESAKHIPDGVILQHNFESGDFNVQLGKQRPLWDYWLSWVGPSRLFSESAKHTAQRGGRMSAKLQVGNSHEIATVPFIPVPGLIYRKYKAMHELGVSSAMQSWYFGNYPSLMTRAAGLLSFAPLPESESAFLLDLARRDWGTQADTVAQAWACFGEAYENYPSTHFFGYYGPVQDGVVWPLHLIPRNIPLAPTWRLDFPPSGDFLADCLSAYFKLDEVLTLCTTMSRRWNDGFALLKEAYAASEQTAAQAHELRIAHAVAIHFEGGLDILRFYALREELVGDASPKRRKELLDEMEAIVGREIDRRKVYLQLLRDEPTLGYHSEAEGYKVTPDKVRRGLRALKTLLKRDFPAVRLLAAQGEPLFGDYTGHAPRRKVLALREATANPWQQSGDALGAPEAKLWKGAPTHPLRHWLIQPRAEDKDKRNNYGGDWIANPAGPAPVRASYRALLHEGALHLWVRFASENGFALPEDAWEPTVTLDIEPRRLQTRRHFYLYANGEKLSLIDEGYVAPEQPPFDTRWEKRENGWEAGLRVPLSSLELEEIEGPFRFNLRITFFNRETTERCELSWIKRKPLKARLAWGDINPATDYGWVKVE